MPFFLIWIIIAYVAAYVDIHSNSVSAIQQAAAAGMGLMAMFLPCAIIRMIQGYVAAKKRDVIIDILEEIARGKRPSE